MRRITTIAELRAWVAEQRGAGRRIGLVPTMGALHRGHLSLVEAAHRDADLVVVSVFVNPTQFAPDEDFDAYPRDLQGDEAKLAALGDAAPDVVFAPDVDEVYPRPNLTTVHVDVLGERLCGRSRPTHFDGVTTVVTKLLNMVAPDAAYFGRKDFQQLTLIRRMAADTNQPVEIVGCPTVREPDGVAMSSRNLYLTDEDRSAARALSQGLRAAVLTAREARDSGTPVRPGMLRDAVTVTLDAEPRIRTDYVEVVDPDTLVPPDERGEENAGAASKSPDKLLVAVAAYLGKARLIDNVVVGDHDDEDRLLSATTNDD